MAVDRMHHLHHHHCAKLQPDASLGHIPEMEDNQKSVAPGIPGDTRRGKLSFIQGLRPEGGPIGPRPLPGGGPKPPGPSGPNSPPRLRFFIVLNV